MVVGRVQFTVGNILLLSYNGGGRRVVHMKKLSELLSDGTIYVLITSGLVASVLANVCSIIVTIYSKRQDRKTESYKNKNVLSEYRYKNLHKYLEMVCELPYVLYGIKEESEILRTIEQSNEKFENVEKIYKMSKPLIDDEVLEKIVDSFKEVEEISNSLVESVYGDLETNKSVQDLLMARNKAEEYLINGIQEQMRYLITRV